jgi:hypothetical protein
VDPTAGLDDLEKRKFLTLPGLELRPLGRIAHNQSLYRLRCPGSSGLRVGFRLVFHTLAPGTVCLFGGHDAKNLTVLYETA